jgi:hypothetical protein
MNSSVITVPVSLGEALDKLTILDIKLQKINDDRRNDVQVEYNMLKEKLKDELEKCSYYYRILKEINLLIWDMQDDFRDKKGDTTILCMKIIEENDRRFRVKKKINDLVNSSLKEQKGYARTKAIIITHLGNGDHITCNGLVRYYSTKYDKITVFCKKQNLNNLEEFYEDEKSISLHGVESDFIYRPKKVENYAKINNYTNVIISGHRKDKTYKDIPFCFYDFVNVPHSVFWNYFHVPTLPKAQELYNSIKNYNYIFVHNSSSIGEVFKVEEIFKEIHENTLIINPCKNFYSQDHTFYSIAERLCNESIASYKLVMENAKINVVCDSSFFCFMMNLELKYDDNFLYNSKNSKWDYIKIFEKYSFDNTKINRKKFKLFENKI